jgi:hypothetical protein
MVPMYVTKHIKQLRNKEVYADVLWEHIQMDMKISRMKGVLAVCGGYIYLLIWQD